MTWNHVIARSQNIVAKSVAGILQVIADRRKSCTIFTTKQSTKSQVPHATTIKDRVFHEHGFFIGDNIFTPIFYIQIFAFFTPILYTNFLHFCIFYTKIFPSFHQFFFTAKFFHFLHQKFCLFLHQFFFTKIFCTNFFSPKFLLFYTNNFSIFTPYL